MRFRTGGGSNTFGKMREVNSSILLIKFKLCEKYRASSKIGTLFTCQ